MLQASLLDCLFLDLFHFSKNGFGMLEVNVRGSDVVQALVIAVMNYLLKARMKDCEMRKVFR